MIDHSRSILAQFFLLVIVACFPCTGVAAELDPLTDEARNHWAFRPVIRTSVPQVNSQSADPLLTPVDSFIVTRLQSLGSKLTSPAERRTLLRRVTFDLIGLLPTPEEIDEFLQDDSPDAYERVVDRLLSSPHYGEAWGRNWLDVVRFAETAGFNADPVRPVAYHYRDYVIRAFNRDLPFDRFIADQLAGDELFPDDAESLAATGYCRMWPDESNASNVHLARQTSLDDLTGNVGSVFLGLSIGCAQCHDHKFDPLLQKDFYELQAFFSGIVLEDYVPIGTHGQLAEYRKAERDWLTETAVLREELIQLEFPARIKLQGDRRMKFPADVLAAVDTPIEARTTMQRQLAFWCERQIEFKENEIPKHLDDQSKIRREEILSMLSVAKKHQPRPTNQARLMAVAELTTTPPGTHRMENGSYDRPREQVVPHYPTFLRRENTQNPPAIVPPNERSSGRRSVLARWISSAENPLTHRVWVNRIWQGHFGFGLVTNANDFGTQTPAPSHPQLLDWLTSDFIERGFSAKHLHRLIVLSATYRQASDTSDAVPPSDGASSALNESSTPYSHFPRQRLSSERIRDAWLMASGQLNDSLFGPGTRPELPPNFGKVDWKVSVPAEQTRRSVYIFAKRNLPYPMMAAFDFPDMHEACGCRTKTTIAPQALMLLNNQLVIQAARHLADRSRIESTSADPAAPIQQAWQIVFGRSASDREIDTALMFIADQRSLIATTDSVAAKNGKSPPNADAEALADLCHALLNANEFLFIE